MQGGIFGTCINETFAGVELLLLCWQGRVEPGGHRGDPRAIGPLPAAQGRPRPGRVRSGGVAGRRPRPRPRLAGEASSEFPQFSKSISSVGLDSSMVEARSCACAWQVMPSNQTLEVESRFGPRPGRLYGGGVDGQRACASRSAPQSQSCTVCASTFTSPCGYCWPTPNLAPAPDMSVFGPECFAWNSLPRHIIQGTGRAATRLQQEHADAFCCRRVKWRCGANAKNNNVSQTACWRGASYGARQLPLR